ncbi:hypothetical protein QCA50_010669 [Cerrena zonata]|uniref:Uncharacterized protein n=1 Tax=Cerrena zonata TaxID=2478898 RepID=A0AAW0FZ20_9APHY
MCLAAITLNIVQDGPLASANFAIRTKLGNTICVRHLVTKDNIPSCFPVGIHALPAGTIAGSSCIDTGIAVTTGTDLIAARS